VVRLRPSSDTAGIDITFKAGCDRKDVAGTGQPANQEDGPARKFLRFHNVADARQPVDLDTGAFAAGSRPHAVAKVGLSGNANTRNATAVRGPVVLVTVWSPNDANARDRPNEMADTKRPGSGHAGATAASGTAKTMADFE